MSQEQAVRIAQRLLAEVPGDIGALPWIGRRTGCTAVSDFIRGTRSLLERIRFDVEGVMAKDDRAAIFGHLISKVNTTGKIIDLPFALILQISAGKITRFQMLEDSFAVSQAARQQRTVGPSGFCSGRR